MSIFGTNQVEEVIIGNAVASEATVAAFIESAAAKEIKAVATDGGAAEAGKLFYLLQKTNGSAAKGLNYEFSDRVNPKKIERITLREYAPETQKTVKVTGFDNILPNKTYTVSIRLYNEGGSLSTENFRILSGYYSTGSDVTGVTAQTVIDGVAAALKAELDSRGGSEFDLSKDSTGITISGQYQPVNPDKGLGRQIEFDVTAKVINQDQENLGLLEVEVLSHNHPGNGTAKQVINKEWFTKGFKYSPYRGMDYPAGFDSPEYADPDGQYNAVIITYKNDRISPTVEDQKRSLIIFVESSAGNEATNELLANLRAFIGDHATVPADLPVDGE